MEDMFFKYGVILVGVVVIVLLMTFAFNALNKTVYINPEKEQSVSGDSLHIKDALIDYCRTCTRQETNQDCYVISLDILEGETLCRDDMPDYINVSTCLLAKTTVRIKSYRNICEVIIVANETSASGCGRCDTESCCSTMSMTEDCYWYPDRSICLPSRCMNDCHLLDAECCGLVTWQCVLDNGVCINI